MTKSDSELLTELRTAGFPKYADMLEHNMEMESLYKVSSEITRLARSLGVVIKDIRTEGDAISFTFGRCSPRHKHQFLISLKHDHSVTETHNRVVVSRV